MPDLLSRALVAYALRTLFALRYPWLTPPYVTVGMAGAFIPDVAKVELVVDPALVAALLGAPFDWFGVRTLGGAAVAALVGVTLAASEYRRCVAGLLALGAGSHLAADALLLKASGHSYPDLWPLTGYHPPTPGLYLSTAIRSSVVTGGVALVTWLLVRHLDYGATAERAGVPISTTAAGRGPSVRRSSSPSRSRRARGR